MRQLNQLRRMADNKRCGTCGHEDRMGFNNVCMKFKIFVCSDCKSAHQSFSHRCKARRRTAARPFFWVAACVLILGSLPSLRRQSVTMSNWNEEEVMELTEAGGGGNRMHNATYLANVPSTYRIPQPGCHPNDMKEWIKEVYHDQKFYDPNGKPRGPPGAAPQRAAAAPAPAPQRAAAPPPVAKSKTAPTWSTYSLSRPLCSQ